MEKIRIVSLSEEELRRFVHREISEHKKIFDELAKL